MAVRIKATIHVIECGERQDAEKGIETAKDYLAAVFQVSDYAFLTIDSAEVVFEDVEEDE